MGEEISETRFEASDFERFGYRLREETALLESRLANGQPAPRSPMVGFEVEAWLINRDLLPLPRNEEYLERLQNPLVVPELSRFNVELNSTPRSPDGTGFSDLEQELGETWRHCQRVAEELDGHLLLIGILPTVRRADLTLSNISPLNRYHALNEQILRRRGGRPLRLDIHGLDHLQANHTSVMPEAAATSFQVHFEVPADRLVRHYNAACLLSAPMVAMAANSPFLFGHRLWDETRIALFEQAVDTGDHHAHPELRRVTFGSGWLDGSVTDYFRYNIEQFPVLLPIRFNDRPEALHHLRLHNGTIWRWNRLLVDSDDGNLPRLRIEHRVMPAGPSIIDMLANAAVFTGACHAFAELADPPEHSMPFGQAREAFYRAARQGLDAVVPWIDGNEHGMTPLLLERILPMAREGLEALGTASADIGRYLEIVRERVRTGRNGATWQRRHAERHGQDTRKLAADYLARQLGNRPVHEWEP